MLSSHPPASAVLRHWSVGQPLLGLAINRRGDWVAAATGGGGVVVLPAEDAGVDPKILRVHEGVSLELIADADAHAFLSAGDDGRLFIIDPEIDAPTQIAEHKGKWIDHVAASASGGLRAYAIGKTLYRLDPSGCELAPPTALPSSIGGLAFSPDGGRLAVSHFGGVSLFDANSPALPSVVLPWKGSFLNLLWSPGGAFLLAALQDNAVHGWKVDAPQAEGGHEMQMAGYESKVRSMAFTAGGKYLATSGAAQAVCWPFTDGGPWEKKPLLLGGVEGRLVTCASPHPAEGLVAVGFDDGMMMLAPLDGRMEIMILPPLAPRGAGVVGMVWNKEGNSLMTATEDGTLRLFTLASISGFVRGGRG